MSFHRLLTSFHRLLSQTMASTLYIRKDISSPYIYNEPVEVGNFSLDGNRDFVFDNEQLKYLSLPRNPNNCYLDLSEGYENVIRKNYLPDKKLNNVLKWIELEKPSFHSDFVCYRGALRNIAILPYKKPYNTFIISASKFRGTIYMSVHYDPVEEAAYLAKLRPEQKLFESMGYKFEQYLTATKPGGIPDTSKGVNENEEFCCVVKAQLNSHSLLIAGEVDSVNPSAINSRSMNRYVELKTIGSTQNEVFYRFKTLDWWAQSYFVGITKIICGIRSRDGIVRSVEEFKTSDLLQLGQEHWKPAICMNFCASFLDFVKRCVTKDDPKVVVTFEYNPENRNWITAQERKPNSEYCFLPTWYKF